jgi:hypothetical protein
MDMGGQRRGSGELLLDRLVESLLDWGLDGGADRVVGSFGLAGIRIERVIRSLRFSMKQAKQALANMTPTCSASAPLS